MPTNDAAPLKRGITKNAHILPAATMRGGIRSLGRKDAYPGGIAFLAVCAMSKLNGSLLNRVFIHV